MKSPVRTARDGRRERWADFGALWGTLAALLVYGVLQERIMTIKFDGELFTYSLFLVACNRITTVCTVALYYAVRGHDAPPAAPLRAYAAVSLSNLASTTCQYEALRYVSFVAQTLAKSAKALPVLVWGCLLHGRRYQPWQLAQALLVTGGCALFAAGGSMRSAAVDEASAAPGSASEGAVFLAGGALLLGYLAADGWTSTQQEKLFSSYRMGVLDQTLHTTAFTAVWALAGTVASGQLLPASQFMVAHPSAAAMVVVFSLAATAIQLCISYTIKRHGALVFAMLMTTRQLLSVLLSNLLFQHHMTALQWCGTGVVFGSLYVGQRWRRRTHSPRYQAIGAKAKDGDSAEAAAVEGGGITAEHVARRRDPGSPVALHLSSAGLPTAVGPLAGVVRLAPKSPR